MCYILYTVHIIYRKVLSLAISVNPYSLSLNVLALFLLKTSHLLWQSDCMELLCQTQLLLSLLSGAVPGFQPLL